MATKTTGAEFKRFYEDEVFWPNDGTYHEDETVFVDGAHVGDWDSENIADAAQLTLSGGIVLGPKLIGKEPSFEAYFKRWKKQQSTTIFAVECSNESKDAVVEAIKAAGGKVI